MPNFVICLTTLRFALFEPRDPPTITIQLTTSPPQVTPGSVSAQAGVQSGDAIVRIGAEDALSLRHKEAQDAIIRAGNSFVMQVQR